MKLSKKSLYFKWNSALVALCVMSIGIVGSSTAIYATISIGPFQSYVINKSGFTIWPIVADLNVSIR
jgi:hypothetical protein